MSAPPKCRCPGSRQKSPRWHRRFLAATASGRDRWPTSPRATGRTPAYARDQVSARLATAEERRRLGLTARSAAVLAVRHVVFDDEGQALECVDAAYPPDSWTFEQEYPIH